MSDIVTGTCLDCGEPTRTPGAIRCSKHHGAFLRQQSLDETAVADRELLDLIGREHLTYGRLAIRLGVSRPRAHQKVANARRREKARNA